MKISVPHIANLINYGAYQGVSDSQLKRLLDEEHIDFYDPDAYIEVNKYLKVLEVIIAKTKNNYFGLHYGCFLNLKALGLILEISLNASSMEQAIFILQNYLASSFPLVNVSVKKERDVCLLQLNCKIQDKDLKRHLLDSVIAIVYRELKLMLKNDMYPELKLPYSELDEYNEFLGVEVEKGNAYTLVLKSEVLKTEINSRRVKEIEYLLPKFLMMLDDKTNDGLFSLQVKNMVLNMCCPELPNFEQVAKQFPLSNRTIQRKLAQEGTSFRKIVNSIKNELSNYLVKGKFLKTKDISLILGYSEPSAYLHAVNNWKVNIESL
ncbi:AraC family transcriptional regulator ligand-binding domain-containing protein [Flavivirga eckloniae]|uniref:HTH-type transcriptional regulator AraC-type N-terminal domain-containing protein n=1 Tax=Flavivirga eckloniae TaxID=1803846 RepID=A0A2K9PNX8_9FLAO|nr:AraC family transcriptional regulator ligand-binding domain-containing protein [Flavivirga eckloniae]AUP78773.1 hypothetical protein C1H87_08700 [Flavivirga eckloniae]